MYDSNCDYNKYKVFYAVAECNSFSKAVDILHISQPAISYAIKQLEEQLDTKLFIRDNRKIKLTDDGEKLMYYLRKAFTDISLAEKTIKEKTKDYQGMIKFGIYHHISLILLPEILDKFTKKYPDIKFEVIASSSNELKEKLKNRELDFIIAQYPLMLENSNVFTEEKILELENCFFTNKYHYDKYINNELKELPLILPFRGYVDIDILDRLLVATNIKIKNTFRIYALELAKKLVDQNLGIGWGPRVCVENELKQKKLYEIFTDFDTPNTKFSITYNEKSLNESCKEFIKYLREETKKYN